MNVYELEKKVTSGPFGLDKCPWYEGYNLKPYLGAAGEWRKEDTMFLAHCRNHFMEALEALKAMIGTAEEDGYGVKDLRALITKLEKVEEA